MNLFAQTDTLRMARKSFVTLLLLVFFFSTAQLQPESDNDIILHGKQTESQGDEPTNVSSRQHACPQDVHAVLREMSALLAELRVEMRHLQRENAGRERSIATRGRQHVRVHIQTTEMFAYNMTYLVLRSDS